MQTTPKQENSNELQNPKHRLITRSNFDGIVNTALFLKLGIVDEILFVHPKDVQEGKVEVTTDDIVSNLPYVQNAHMAFDHLIDTPDVMKINKNHALFTDARSVSEIIYEYYGGEEVFGEELLPLVEAANRSKTANFTEKEVLSPEGWNRLIFLTDPRTGLGRFKNFRISNKALMHALPKMLLDQTIDEILENPDVKERVEVCERYHEAFVEQLERVTFIEDGVAVVDLRHEETIYPGNRYMIYARFPQVHTSIHLLPGVENQNTVLALGASIFNRSQALHMRNLVETHGGGGHENAATCQIAHEEADKVLEKIVSDIKEQLKTEELLCETS